MISRPEDASWISHETFATQNKQVARFVLIVYQFYTNSSSNKHFVDMYFSLFFRALYRDSTLTLN